MASYLCINRSNSIQSTRITEVLKISLAIYNILEVRSEEGKDIGIDKAKEVTRFTNRPPMSGDQKLAIIHDAHKLTTDAQNALLKTLEEHPEYVDIVLVARSELGIAETVLSRCKRIILPTEGTLKQKRSKETLSELLNTEIGTRASMALKLSKKEKPEIIDILNHWVWEAQTMEKYVIAESIIQILNDIENTNVNTRLALENLMFNLK
jgi:DNA polymerase III delta prime subunit